VTRRFVVLPDTDAVAVAAADRFVALAANAVRRRGAFRVAISGGFTPRAAYALLAATPRATAVDWSRVELFWVDERTVPPDHPDSNFGAARGGGLARMEGLRDGAVHRMRAEAPDLDAAAHAYQAEIATVFGIPADAPPPPFDLVWLGMGHDGHTASLFPGSPALAELRRWVVGAWAPGPASWRMTLTFPVLNAAREAVFTVCGPDKAAAFALVRAGASQLPAARVRARRTLWLVDASTAGSGGDPA